MFCDSEILWVFGISTPYKLSAMKTKWEDDIINKGYQVTTYSGHELCSYKTKQI